MSRHFILLYASILGAMSGHFILYMLPSSVQCPDILYFICCHPRCYVRTFYTLYAAILGAMSGHFIVCHPRCNVRIFYSLYSVILGAMSGHFIVYMLPSSVQRPDILYFMFKCSSWNSEPSATDEINAACVYMVPTLTNVMYSNYYTVLV
jgi:hypothetical protein